MDKETRNAIQTATQQARRLLVDDFTEQMDAILHRNKTPADAIRDLMARSGKSEIALRA